MKLWRNSTRSLQSLQRSKSNISIITNQLSTLHSTCDINVLFIKGKDPKTYVSKMQEGVRKGSNSILNQEVKVRTCTFKINNKVETNSKNRDIVWMKIAKFIEQGFYKNFKNLKTANFLLGLRPTVNIAQIPLCNTRF